MGRLCMLLFISNGKPNNLDVLANDHRHPWRVCAANFSTIARAVDKCLDDDPKTTLPPGNRLSSRPHVVRRGIQIQLATMYAPQGPDECTSFARHLQKNWDFVIDQRLETIAKCSGKTLLDILEVPYPTLIQNNRKSVFLHGFPNRNRSHDRGIFSTLQISSCPTQPSRLALVSGLLPAKYDIVPRQVLRNKAWAHDELISAHNADCHVPEHLQCLAYYLAPLALLK